MAYTILSGDVRAVGTGNPPADMNNVNDVLIGMGFLHNVTNTAWAGGADPAGVADSTAAIQAALTAALPGQTVFLPQGTYKISAPLTMSTQNVTLAGTGLGNTNKTGASVLLISSVFTGNAAVAITGFGCQVLNLCVFGTSTTVTSNPLANGVEITGSKFSNLANLFFQYVNGWAVESAGGASNANLGTSMYNLTGYNCAGGIHVKGVTGSAFAGQHSLIDCQFSQIGTSTALGGANANLDAMFFEDCQDILTLNTNCAVSSASTGATLHIKGICASHVHQTVDIGVFPVTGTANPVILIEDSGNGSPTQIVISGGVAQAGLTGMTITGGANQVDVRDMWFKNNVTHGVVLAGTGTQVNFTSCTWSVNGQGAAGTNYDLSDSGTVQGHVRGCHFLSPVTTTGTAGVQSVVNMTTGGTDLNFADCDFSGAGSALSTVFTNLPSFVRGCKGYNPHGAITVAVPGSGSPVATALHYDAFYYITAGTGGCTIVRNTNGQGGGVGPSIVIPAGQLATVFVTAGSNFTPTYANAPTWVVDGA